MRAKALDAAGKRAYRGSVSFGPLLARARKARGMKAADVAAQVGVAATTISQWENDHRRPDVEQLRDLCRVLHVSADVLLERVPFQLGPVEPEDPTVRFQRACEAAAALDPASDDFDDALVRLDEQFRDLTEDQRIAVHTVAAMPKVQRPAG